MKKRTKKKLRQYSWNGVKALAKGVFYYPIKGIWWLISKGASQIQERSKNADVGAKQGRKTVEPFFESFVEIKSKKGDTGNFEKYLFSNKSTIGLILGARGTGKSALGMRLLENFSSKTGKNIYAMGFDAASLPRWINVVDSIDQIKNNSVILIDEGGIEFSSRKAMTNANKLLSEILLIARHKDLNVIFITQNSANLEVNAIRQADYLLLKPSSLLQKDFERKKIKEVYESVDEEFAQLKGTQGLLYIYSDAFRGFATNSLPSFWSESVSKGYAKR